jgi:hypothetical protein
MTAVPIDRGPARTCMGIGLIDLEHPEWRRDPQIAQRCIGITRTENHDAKVIAEMRPVAANAQIVLCLGMMTYRLPRPSGTPFSMPLEAQSFGVSGGATSSSVKSRSGIESIGRGFLDGPTGNDNPWMMRCQGPSFFD